MKIKEFIEVLNIGNKHYILVDDEEYDEETMADLEIAHLYITADVSRL